MTDEDRSGRIVDTLVEAFSDLMRADPEAFRTKFRKMAADPFAFYRGSACLFYADVAERDDPWADERTGRVWIQGDLHAENFGTYMDGDGVLIFDVNDFDEAYVGHFTWDVTRFAASLALLGWRKALSDEAITDLVRSFASFSTCSTEPSVVPSRNEKLRSSVSSTNQRTWSRYALT
jgi:uncharacterized protein (DUF2252 family)